MKRIMTFILMIITVTLCMCSCSFSVGTGGTSGGDNNSTSSTSQKNKEVNIIIKNGDESISKTVKVGEKASITISGKREKYLDGIYDTEEGEEGTKYFDCLGNALVEWEESFPTTLYARWKDISSLKQVIDAVGNEPRQSTQYLYCIQETLKLDDNFISALKGNFDKKLKIQYKAELKRNPIKDVNVSLKCTFKGYKSDGADKHTIFEYIPKTTSFENVYGTVLINAADFVDGDIYLKIEPESKSDTRTFYIRNLSFTISLAE